MLGRTDPGPPSRVPWLRFLGALVVVGVLLLGAVRLIEWQAARDNERGLEECRREVAARGVPASDPQFDLAVAVCNLRDD